MSMNVISVVYIIFLMNLLNNIYHLSLTQGGRGFHLQMLNDIVSLVYLSTLILKVITV